VNPLTIIAPSAVFFVDEKVMERQDHIYRLYKPSPENQNKGLRKSFYDSMSVKP